MAIIQGQYFLNLFYHQSVDLKPFSFSSVQVIISGLGKYHAIYGAIQWI